MDRRSPSPTASSPPRRSLNIPKQLVLPALPLQSVLDNYSQHPNVATLDQIMLHYLDMEEILKMYSRNHEMFETRQALGILALRFQLPAAKTFKELLKSYDMKYATVRSYLYNNRNPRKILLQAALEGDIQAFYNQLKLYPRLRNKHVYTAALEKAAEGGHRAIIDLVLDLGVLDKKVMLTGAAKGGHLDLFKQELAEAENEGIEVWMVQNLASVAAANNREEVLDYIFSINSSKILLNSALAGAGSGGDLKLIEYLIAKGADGYKLLVENAASKGRLIVVKKYYDKIDVGERPHVFEGAARYSQLDIIKYLFETGTIEPEYLYGALKYLEYIYIEYSGQLQQQNNLSSNGLDELVDRIDRVSAIIQYLESQGFTNEASTFGKDSTSSNGEDSSGNGEDSSSSNGEDSSY